MFIMLHCLHGLQADKLVCVDPSFILLKVIFSRVPLTVFHEALFMVFAILSTLQSPVEFKTCVQIELHALPVFFPSGNSQSPFAHYI
jgi:hypothetical protein